MTLHKFKASDRHSLDRGHFLLDAKYESLQSNDLDATLCDIMFANAIPMDKLDGVRRHGLFLQTSRFNHSCSPNAEYSRIKDSCMQEVRALRGIQPGEEICVSYFGRNWSHLFRPTAARQRDLVPILSGSGCQCNACAAADAQSDARRVALMAAEDGIEQALHNGNPEDGLLKVEEKFTLLEIECIPFRGTTMINAFLLAAQTQSQEEMQKWATRGYEYYRSIRGEDDAATKHMRTFANRPPHNEGELFVNATWLNSTAW